MCPPEKPLAEAPTARTIPPAGRIATGMTATSMMPAFGTATGPEAGRRATGGREGVRKRRFCRGVPAVSRASGRVAARGFGSLTRRWEHSAPDESELYFLTPQMKEGASRPPFASSCLCQDASGLVLVRPEGSDEALDNHVFARTLGPGDAEGARRSPRTSSRRRGAPGASPRRASPSTPGTACRTSYCIPWRCASLYSCHSSARVTPLRRSSR